MSPDTTEIVDDGDPSPQRVRRRSTRARRSPWRGSRGIAVVAVAAAVAAASVSTAAPTGVEVIDRLWVAAAAALVTTAGSTARRWTLVVLAAAAAALAAPGVPQVAALVALAASIVLLLTADRRERVVNAAVAGLAVVGLSHTDDLLTTGATTALAVTAAIPAVVSGYRTSRSTTRRRALVAGGAVVAIGLVAAGAAAVAALSARAALEDAADEARAGLDQVRAGDTEAAAATLTDARSSFADAASTLSGPLGLAGRAVPGVGAQLTATIALAEAGEGLTEEAARSASEADWRDLKATDGQIDLQLAASIAEPARRANDRLHEADARLAAVDHLMLLPPVRTALEDFGAELEDVLPEAELADDALAIVPDMLGASGPRRYLVLFATPAEARFGGGFVGGWGIITASDGRLELTRTGRSGELMATGPGERTITASPTYLERYGRLDPARFFQNVTASPDFPTVAEVAAELYPQAAPDDAAPVDGVIYVDPYGLAALLELTGPLAVDGLDAPLTPENAADFLLREQYVRFPIKDEREDLLTTVAEDTFDALLAGDLPGPATLSETLDPAVDGGRLLMWSADPEEQALLERVGADGAFDTGAGAEGEADVLAVLTSNANPSKIDVYLHRSVDYTVEVDRDTGELRAVAEVTLRNDAPATGLPRYVIGNRDLLDGTGDRPEGSNTMYLSFYSGHDLVDATLDGAPIAIEVQPELGATAYSTRLTIPAGATRVLRLELEGRAPVGPYEVVVHRQPLVNPDDVTITVSDPLLGERPRALTAPASTGPEGPRSMRLTPADDDESGAIGGG